MILYNIGYNILWILQTRIYNKKIIEKFHDIIKDFIILFLMKSGFIALFHYPRFYESLRENNEWYNINLPSFLRTGPFSSARRTSTKLDVRLGENSLSAPGLSEGTGNPTDIADVQYLLKIRRQVVPSPPLLSSLLLSISPLAKKLTTASPRRDLSRCETRRVSASRVRRVSSADRDASQRPYIHIAWNNKFYGRLDASRREIVARDPESESVISPRRVNVNGVGNETRRYPSSVPSRPYLRYRSFGADIRALHGRFSPARKSGRISRR